MRNLVVAVVAAVFLGAACSEQATGEKDVDAADAPAIVASEEVPDQSAPSSPMTEREQLGKRGDRTLPPGSFKPAVPGVNEGRFYTPPATEQEPAEDSDHPKNKGTTVVSSDREGLSWKLNVHREDGKTCLVFVFRATMQGGGSETCEQKPPLDSSGGGQNAHGRVLWGLTSNRVAHVRVEHADGATETFATVAHDGYTERFYAGEIARTPIERLVGLDAAGRTVAEKADMEHYNR